MKTYHIGLSIHKKTMIIEMVHNKDYLSCELYDYLGERCVTKKHVKENRYSILNIMKKQRPEVYNNLKYAIVE